MTWEEALSFYKEGQRVILKGKEHKVLHVGLITQADYDNKKMGRNLIWDIVGNVRIILEGERLTSIRRDNFDSFPMELIAPFNYLS